METDQHALNTSEDKMGSHSEKQDDVILNRENVITSESMLPSDELEEEKRILYDEQEAVLKSSNESLPIHSDENNELQKERNILSDDYHSKSNATNNMQTDSEDNINDEFLYNANLDKLEDTDLELPENDSQSVDEKILSADLQTEMVEQMNSEPNVTLEPSSNKMFKNECLAEYEIINDAYNKQILEQNQQSPIEEHDKLFLDNENILKHSQNDSNEILDYKETENGHSYTESTHLKIQDSFDTKNNENKSIPLPLTSDIIENNDVDINNYSEELEKNGSNKMFVQDVIDKNKHALGIDDKEEVNNVAACKSWFDETQKTADNIIDYDRANVLISEVDSQQENLLSSSTAQIPVSFNKEEANGNDLDHYTNANNLTLMETADCSENMQVNTIKTSDIDVNSEKLDLKEPCCQDDHSSFSKFDLHPVLSKNNIADFTDVEKDQAPEFVDLRKVPIFNRNDNENVKMENAYKPNADDIEECNYETPKLQITDEQISTEHTINEFKKNDIESPENVHNNICLNTVPSFTNNIVKTDTILESEDKLGNFPDDLTEPKLLSDFKTESISDLPDEVDCTNVVKPDSSNYEIHERPLEIETFVKPENPDNPFNLDPNVEKDIKFDKNASLSCTMNNDSINNPKPVVDLHNELQEFSKTEDEDQYNAQVTNGIHDSTKIIESEVNNLPRIENKEYAVCEKLTSDKTLLNNVDFSENDQLANFYENSINQSSIINESLISNHPNIYDVENHQESRNFEESKSDLINCESYLNNNLETPDLENTSKPTIMTVDLPNEPLVQLVSEMETESDYYNENAYEEPEIAIQNITKFEYLDNMELDSVITTEHKIDEKKDIQLDKEQNEFPSQPTQIYTAVDGTILNKDNSMHDLNESYSKETVEGVSSNNLTKSGQNIEHINGISIEQLKSSINNIPKFLNKIACEKEDDYQDEINCTNKDSISQINETKLHNECEVSESGQVQFIFDDTVSNTMEDLNVSNEEIKFNNKDQILESELETKLSANTSKEIEIDNEEEHTFDESQEISSSTSMITEILPNTNANLQIKCEDTDNNESDSIIHLLSDENAIDIDNEIDIETQINNNLKLNLSVEENITDDNDAFSMHETTLENVIQANMCVEENNNIHHDFELTKEEINLTNVDFNNEPETTKEGKNSFDNQINNLEHSGKTNIQFNSSYGLKNPLNEVSNQLITESSSLQSKDSLMYAENSSNAVDLNINTNVNNKLENQTQQISTPDSLEYLRENTDKINKIFSNLVSSESSINSRNAEEKLVNESRVHLISEKEISDEISPINEQLPDFQSVKQEENSNIYNIAANKTGHELSNKCTIISLSEINNAMIHDDMNKPADTTDMIQTASALMEVCDNVTLTNENNLHEIDTKHIPSNAIEQKDYFDEHRVDEILPISNEIAHEIALDKNNLNTAQLSEIKPQLFACKKDFTNLITKFETSKDNLSNDKTSNDSSYSSEKIPVSMINTHPNEEEFISSENLLRIDELSIPSTQIKASTCTEMLNNLSYDSDGNRLTNENFEISTSLATPSKVVETEINSNHIDGVTENEVSIQDYQSPVIDIDEFNEKYAEFVGKILPGHAKHLTQLKDLNKRGGTLNRFDNPKSTNSLLWDSSFNKTGTKSATIDFTLSEKYKNLSILLEPKPTINDDHLYPDSVTPSKVEKSLVTLNLKKKNSKTEYDVPFIDDEAFFLRKKYLYPTSNDAFYDEVSSVSDLENMDSKQNLLQVDHIARLDESISSTEVMQTNSMISKKPTLTHAQPNSWSFNFGICGCLRRRQHLK